MLLKRLKHSTSFYGINNLVEITKIVVSLVVSAVCLDISKLFLIIFFLV